MFTRARREAENLADIAVCLALGNPQQTPRISLCQRKVPAQHLVVGALRWSAVETKQIFVRTDGAEEGELQSTSLPGMSNGDACRRAAAAARSFIQSAILPTTVSMRVVAAPLRR